MWGTYRCVTSCWKKIKLKNSSAVCDHLTPIQFLPSFGNVRISAHENKKHLLESRLIMREKPSLNRNINSASLYLFDKVFYQVLVFSR